MPGVCRHLAARDSEGVDHFRIIDYREFPFVIGFIGHGGDAFTDFADNSLRVEL
jgi:hypothetical protein